MSNFYEELKKYFENTPKEKILADWEKTKHLDNVGPTVDEYFNYVNIINNKYHDKNGVLIKNGDIIDINQTVNGENIFIIVDLNTQNVRYFRNPELRYEYDVDELLTCDPAGLDIEIIGNIDLNRLKNHI